MRSVMPQRKKLIIVYSDGLDKYANYLMQLISSNDDGDSVVGVPDGCIEATIWSDKEYESSVHSLSSSTYIIFVGSGPIAVRARANMNWRIDELGMHFGWLGTQACMYVDDSLNRENYEEFVERCEEYGQIFHSGIGLLEGRRKDDESESLRANNVTVEGIEECDDGDEENKLHPDLASSKWRQIMGEERGSKVSGEGTDNGLHEDNMPAATSSGFIGIVTKPFKAIAGAVDAMGANLGALISSNESRDRQYTLLTRIVYLDGLSEFMGI